MSVFFELWKNKYSKVIIVSISVFITLNYLLPLVLPFVLAILFIASIHPLLEKVHNKTKIGKGIFAALLLLLLVVIIMGVMGGICSSIFSNLGELLDSLHEIEIQILVFIQGCCDELENVLGIDAMEIEIMVMSKVEEISENLQLQFGPTIMGESISYMRDILSVGAFVAVTFIAVVLLAKDFHSIKKIFQTNKSLGHFSEIIAKIGSLVKVFAKAQIIILLIISGLCVIGLLLIGTENAVGLGVIIGCFDLLPFIGTSIILLPLCILYFLAGEVGKGIGVIVLYIVCVLTRELLEPKLIGDKVGISPIYILMGIYVGVGIYGISGIILGPLSLLIINEIGMKNTQ